MQSGAQVGGNLQKFVGVGRVVFNLPLHAPYWFFLPRDHAFGSLSSSADGRHYSVMAQAPSPNPIHVGAVKGTVSHLDEYQAYDRQDGDASLRITISDLLLPTVGRQQPPRRLGVPADGRLRAGAHRRALPRPRVQRAGPAGLAPRGELFAVHVSLEAEAVDDRGGESAAQAFIQDPQKPGPLLLNARGLAPRGKPRFKEPPARKPRAAGCRGGRARHAGVLQFSDPRFVANESERSRMVLVTRGGGARGRVSATVTARSGTARAGRDFRRTSAVVAFGKGDRSPRPVEIPLGKMVAAGTAGADVALVRDESDGTPDPGFGAGGVVTTAIGPSEAVANGVALAPGGGILVAGFTLGRGINRDFLLARYGTDGSPDTAFGDHGTVVKDRSGGDDFALLRANP